MFTALSCEDYMSFEIPCESSLVNIKRGESISTTCWAFLNSHSVHANCFLCLSSVNATFWWRNVTYCGGIAVVSYLRWGKTASGDVVSTVPSRFDVGDVPRAEASSVGDCDLFASTVGPDDYDGDVVA